MASSSTEDETGGGGMSRGVPATAVAVLLCSGLVALVGCQPQQQTPPPVTPTPTAASPSETQQERTMRLDREAAEKVYVTVTAEVEKLALAGGTTKPSRVILENTSGTYRDVLMKDLGTLKEQGWRIDRKTTTSVVANRGWSPTEVGLTACEDASQVRLLNRANKEVSKDRPRRFVQALTAMKVNDRWRITDIKSKIVKTFDGEAGCQT